MNTTSSQTVTITGINKFYGIYQALRDVSLQDSLGEKVLICGPSGSGKSTLIRCINQEHQSGTIDVLGTVLDDRTSHIDDIRREVGMVFQNLEPLPAHDRSGELCAGPDDGAQVLARQRGRDGDAFPAQGPHSRASDEISVHLQKPMLQLSIIHGEFNGLPILHGRQGKSLELEHVRPSMNRL